MQVEIWSDVVCPWCVIGKRRFEQALTEFEHRDEVEVVWRSFELDPSAPRGYEGDYATRLAGKYGVSVDEAQSMIDRMVEAGAESGLDLRFDRARPGNTFDAHRLLHLAAERGVQDALKERLLIATFTEGVPVADHEALVAVATEVGLDEAEVREVLAGTRYADAVRADEEQARAFGVNGVPFFVVDRRYGVSGAQHPDLFLDVLRRARDEANGELAHVHAGGESCADGSCSI